MALSRASCTPIPALGCMDSWILSDRLGEQSHHAEVTTGRACHEALVCGA